MRELTDLVVVGVVFATIAVIIKVQRVRHAHRVARREAAFREEALEEQRQALRRTRTSGYITGQLPRKPAPAPAGPLVRAIGRTEVDGSPSILPALAVMSLLTDNGGSGSGVADAAPAPFSGFDGGMSGGAGASSGWDSAPSTPSCGESSPSYDSGGSFDSGSMASCDAGSSSGGGDF